MSSNARVAFFLLVGWWAGICLWILGLAFKLTIILWPFGELCESLAYSCWRV